MTVRAMGQVTVNVNGRSYRFDCGDGEEPRLQELAAHLKSRIDKLTAQFGRVGEERLLLMAALLITDELMDARASAAEKKSPAAEKEKPGANGLASVKTPAAQAAERREQNAIRSEHNRRIAAGEA
jgi:cell division protein ZapA